MVTGVLIRRHRCHLKLSVEALADRAMLMIDDVFRFERGESIPDLYDLTRLSAALCRSMGGLVYLIDAAYSKAVASGNKHVTSGKEVTASAARRWARVAADKVFR